MHLHLVTTHMHGGGPHRALREEGAPCTLMSYAHRRVETFLRGCWGPEHRLIIDSGAFTAWSAGEPIRPEAYAEWALEFARRWRRRLGALEFMTLDVIGDQDASWRNLAVLRLRGLDPIPIVTCGAGLHHLERALEESGRVALGGLVPLTRDREALRGWLDACFRRVRAWVDRRAGAEWPRLHLLGVTQPWVLHRYPAFSVDSSSWETTIRYGGAAGVLPAGRVPLNTEAPLLNLYVLRRQIRAARALADRVTAIWRARGIDWSTP